MCLHNLVTYALSYAMLLVRRGPSAQNRARDARGAFAGEDIPMYMLETRTRIDCG